MPESKTIQIDEVVTSAESPRDKTSGRAKPSEKKPNPDPSAAGFGDPQNVFSSFKNALPLKARIMLKVAAWFMFLRSKKWGKWVMVPAIILGIMIAIPAALFFVLFLIIRSAFSPLKR